MIFLKGDEVKVAGMPDIYIVIEERVEHSIMRIENTRSGFNRLVRKSDVILLTCARGKNNDIYCR